MEKTLRVYSFFYFKVFISFRRFSFGSPEPSFLNPSSIWTSSPGSYTVSSPVLDSEARQLRSKYVVSTWKHGESLAEDCAHWPNPPSTVSHVSSKTEPSLSMLPFISYSLGLERIIQKHIHRRIPNPVYIAQKNWGVNKPTSFPCNLTKFKYAAHGK